MEATSVEQISPDDLMFHQRVLAQVNRDIELARAPLLLWNKHVVDKYHLQPQDTIEENGVIVRVQVEESSHGSD